MSNNTVQLTGYLGNDAKVVNHDDKSFTVLSIATKDWYRILQNDEMKWKETEAEWHEVYVFNPFVAKIANDLKKGDKVEIIGSISYKAFKDENGKARKQALIKGYFIDRIDYEKRETGITQQLVDELANSLAG